MLDWIFDGITGWIASVMTELMDAVSGLFLEALGVDLEVMVSYFPFVKAAFSVMQYTAWALLFMIVVWQLFRAFGGPITEAENPMVLIARGALFAFLIGFAFPIFNTVMQLAVSPYRALMDTSLDPGSFTFAGLEAAIGNGLVAFIAISSSTGVLLLIILMVSIAWNYFKLLLEVVERYVMVGVLCYTSPLAFAAGASKSTSRVFQSWCRMVGAQLLLLVLNVWFLRGFDSSVGVFIASGGSLSNGKGSLFLWFFCALAFLKIAQRCDSHLSALGLSVAQTGGNMGMELLLAARTITGFAHGGGGCGAASMLNGAAGGGTGTAAQAAGGLSGFASRFRPNSFVRDAVVNGGTLMGAGGGVGFVGRMFGGMAARNGASLTAESISSVASRPARVSGTIGGDIADRSLPNYMPHLNSGAASQMQYTDTSITGGHIRTTATDAQGRQTDVRLYSASQFERPEGPVQEVHAADGSLWYQTASGSGSGAFYETPEFTGDASEASQVAESFPGAPEGTLLRTADEGVLEASYADGRSSTWLSSAFYEEPDAPHETIRDSSGLDWYAMSPHAAPPAFKKESPAEGGGDTFTVPSGEPVGDTAVFGAGFAEIQDARYPFDASGSADIPGGSDMDDMDFDNDFSESFARPDITEIRNIPGAYGAGGTMTPHGEAGVSSAPGDAGSYGFSEIAGSTISTGETVVPGTPNAGGASGSSEVFIPSIPSGFSGSPNASGTDVPVPSPGFSSAPDFSGADGASGFTDAAGMALPSGTPHTSPASGPAPSPDSIGAAEYRLAQFRQFLPGFDQPVTSVNTSGASDCVLEVRHSDGSGTAFYDRTMYQPPRGDYRVFEDRNGSQWYAVSGTPAVERRPVYRDGKPVYEDNTLQAVEVETVRYRNTPSRYPATPERRSNQERKPPRRKN